MKHLTSFGIVSAASGLALTLLSGLFKTPFTSIGVDVLYRGASFTWTIIVLPTHQFFLWNMLFLDVALWTGLAFVAITLSTRYGLPLIQVWR